MAPPVQPFSTTTDRIGEVAVLRLFGELDMSVAGDLDTDCRRLMDEGVTALVVDATHLVFIDSSGLDALVECTHLIHEEGRVAVVPSRTVRRILELAELSALLHTEETMEKAVKAVTEPPDMGGQVNPQGS